LLDLVEEEEEDPNAVIKPEVKKDINNLWEIFV